ncbi:MAG: beta-N-acetylhexosaminidase, partial [Betaproteobacteria bacterium]|nr:beta-N-acetylhexosaminidase [Betaproteobacteria bacterium]
ERARAALHAGCDMVLLCGDPEGQDRLLQSLPELASGSAARTEQMRHRGGRDLRRSVAYRDAQGALGRLA